MKNKNKIDLAIVTRESFPIGMAATNRILSYATELSSYKNILILIATPTESSKNTDNKNTKGYYKNIEFKYIHNNTVWPLAASKAKKLQVLLKSFPLLFKNLKRNRPKSVLLVSNDIFLMWSLWIFSKILNFKYYQEKSEKPPVMKANVNNLYKKIYLNSYQLFDGIIVMTNELTSILHKTGQFNTFHLPMTVDMDRFENLSISRNNTRTKFLFKYCGGGNIEKDGIINIVKAFIILKENNKSFEFHILGPLDTNDSCFLKVNKLIKDNWAQDYIIFKGSYPSFKIPKLISEADCLIMARSQDYVSAGFPSKLGEYLATGLPVICTSVGEIPLYLNNSCAIIIPPNDIDAILNALKKLMDNYEEYEKIGRKGKIIAKKNFTMEAYTFPLIDFLEL